MDLNSSIASYVSKKRSGMNNTSLGPSMPMHTPNCTTVSFPRLCSQQARPSALRHKGTPSPPRTFRRRPLHLIYRHINQSSYPAHGAHELSALSGVLKTGPALQACCSDHPSPHRPPPSQDTYLCSPPHRCCTATSEAFVKWHVFIAARCTSNAARPSECSVLLILRQGHELHPASRPGLIPNPTDVLASPVCARRGRRRLGRKPREEVQNAASCTDGETPGDGHYVMPGRMRPEMILEI